MADSLTPIIGYGVGFAVVSCGRRGFATGAGPSAGISTVCFFGFLVLPTSTIGEVVGVAFGAFDQGQNPFFLVVCCFAGDSFTWGEGDGLEPCGSPSTAIIVAKIVASPRRS